VPEDESTNNDADKIKMGLRQGKASTSICAKLLQRLNNEPMLRLHQLVSSGKLVHQVMKERDCNSAAISDRVLDSVPTKRNKVA
jgi:hypothetical protein